MNTTKYYVASKTRHALMWRRLRASGANIISTWIDEAEPGQTGNLSELSVRCIEEVKACDTLVLYCVDDDILKGALIEVGVALALGKPVRCVAPNGRIGMFEKHPLWSHFYNFGDAFAFPVLGWLALPSQKRPEMPASVNACQKCGMPGATMHYPGGFLCPGGCSSDSIFPLTLLG